MARFSRASRIRTVASAVVGLSMVGFSWAQIAQAPSAAPLRSSWTWSPFLDAVQAAPKSHRVLLENDRVRVLEVVLQPGQREPIHTHEWPGVMYVTTPAQLRHFTATLTNGKWVEKPEDGGTPAPAPNPNRPRPPQYLEPEGPHAAENIGNTPYRALRVEIKTPQ